MFIIYFFFLLNFQPIKTAPKAYNTNGSFSLPTKYLTLGTKTTSFRYATSAEENLLSLHLFRSLRPSLIISENFPISSSSDRFGTDGRRISVTSRNAGESYLGSFISLISKYEIRYEGVLYCLNVQDSTIGLKNVKSFGTESRKKDGPQIPLSDKVYEYILFRGSDIKDLQVKSSPPAQIEEQIHNDPAIIQSQHAGLPHDFSPLPSVGSRTFTESNKWQDAPALSNRAYPVASSASQSASQIGSPNHFQGVLNAGAPSASIPQYWQGYNRSPTSVPGTAQNLISNQSPSSLSLSLPMQNHLPAHGLQIQATPTSLINTSEPVATVTSPVAAASLYSHFTPPLAPLQSSSLPDVQSPSSIKTSPLSQAAYATANQLTMPSFLSSFEETNPTEAGAVSKAGIHHVADQVHPAQSMPHHLGSPFFSSASGILHTPTPSLVTPDQFAQSRLHALSSTRINYPDQKGVGPGSLGPSYIPSVNSTPATQPPLLPLPVAARQSQFSDTQFTEEFDFEAMNEKFKKDEVWGYLGKAKQRDETKGSEDNAPEQIIGHQEFLGQSSNLDLKPAYQKDDFFDTISCNSLNRGHGGRNGQNRFTDRMRQDTETFGNVPPRPYPNYGPHYGGYGGGRGENFRGSYNWGRGYGYGGRRGRGGNMHY